MAVFRIEKTRDYTVMSNHHLRDKSLSLKAKGLLSLMLSLPEEWDYTTKGLARICKDGVDSICAGVRELEEHGYVIRQRVRNANGQLGAIEYTILEQPRPPEPKPGKPERENPALDNPEQASPVLGEPEQENPAQLNTNAPASHNIPVIQIESKTAQINDAVEYDISERLKDNFGVLVSGIDIGAIEIDKSSEGYRQLMSVTKELAGATAKAEAEARIKDIAAKQRIEAENYEETLRIQREEGQYAQHKQTQTANLGAFQVEKQAEVGVAGANALGQMGANGAGNVNLGGGDGFNMAAMMASMAVGGAVGQNIAGAMNNMMGGINQQTTMGAVPPPIPTVAYHVAVNGQATGPFDTSALMQMVASGQLTADSLVWKNGMAQWEKAGTVDELKNLFSTMPPIPPTEK